MLRMLTIAYVAVSLVATIVALRSPHFDRTQKVFQTAVIWALPVAGALIMLVFHSIVHRNMSTRAKPDSRWDNTDESLSDIKDLD